MLSLFLLRKLFHADVLKKEQFIKLLSFVQNTVYNVKMVRKFVLIRMLVF